MDMLTLGSVFTNIVLCCYASDQIDYVLPWLKNLREDSATSLVTVFGIEHVMVAIVLIIRFTISNHPRWLRIFNERMHHKNVKKQERAELMKRKTLHKDEIANELDDAEQDGDIEIDDTDRQEEVDDDEDVIE